jgi:hypothetical protein
LQRTAFGYRVPADPRWEIASFRRFYPTVRQWLRTGERYRLPPPWMVRRRFPNLRAAFQTLRQAKAFIRERWSERPYPHGPFAHLLAEAGVGRRNPIVAAVLAGDAVAAQALFDLAEERGAVVDRRAVLRELRDMGVLPARADRGAD